MMFHLDNFEGPFDLLYHLINKNEIDLYDIPIAELTNQYMDYLKQSTCIDMNDMSEFVLMASTLLEIKSRMLLPLPEKEQPEEDPRALLVQKLLEYKKYKEAATQLKDRQQEASLVFFKPAKSLLSFLPKKEEQDLRSFLSGVTIESLSQAFEEVMRRKEQKIDKVRSHFRSIEKDLYSMEDKMALIKDILTLTPVVRFHEIFHQDVEKMEVVITFLALLELMKIKQVCIVQNHTYDEITITKYNERDAK